jgi:hypothetical protein
MKGVVSNDGAFFIGRSEENSRKKGAQGTKGRSAVADDRRPVRVLIFLRLFLVSHPPLMRLVG